MQPPPIPANAADAARWEHTRLARRILYGRWERDLEIRAEQLIGIIRRDAWRKVDLSANALRSTFSDLARSHDSQPPLSHPDPSAAPLFDAIAAGGIWPMMQTVERDTLALKEMFVRVDVVDGALSYRRVFPDYVLAYSLADRPQIPVQIREARQRMISGRWRWSWDVLDITDPAAPFYRVHLDTGGDLGEDITAAVLGDVGDYPYRRTDGTPILPYAMWHARASGALFDAWANFEIVEATLNLGVMYTNFTHVIRTSSWAQRWTVDLEVEGTEIVTASGQSRAAITTDPSTVIMLKSSADGASPQVGQWSTTADPGVLIGAIERYERRALAAAGVNPADAQRIGADPRSGWALTVSRDGQRESMRRLEPQWAAGDLSLVEISAVLLNRGTGTSYPEAGYSIGFVGIPLSPEERRLLLEEIEKEVELGLMDKIEAYIRLHPGTDRATAARALEEIQFVNSGGEPDQGAAIGAPVADDVAKTAMNGAQVSSMIVVVEQVTAKLIPPASAIALLMRSFQMTEAEAESIILPASTFQTPTNEGTT